MSDSPRFAVLDIGSNSIKFVVAQYHDGELSVLSEHSCPTRLAEGALTTGMLSDASMERTLKVLKDLGSEARRLRASTIHAVATSAVRDAGNRKQFVKEAREALGGTLHIYSGEEEAQGVFAGVTSDPAWQDKPVMIFDVGGGSAEWIQGKSTVIERELSLPLGAVRLRERFIPDYPMGHERVAKMKQALRSQLEVALAHFHLKGRNLIGTGGSMTTLAAIEQGLQNWDFERIDRYALTRQQIDAFIERLTPMPLAEIERIPGLPAKRTDLILPAAILIETAMEVIAASRLNVSLRGLRYGVLLRLLKESGFPACPLRLSHQDQMEAESELVRRLDESAAA